MSLFSLINSLFIIGFLGVQSAALGESFDDTYQQKIRRWRGYVRDFRSEHNFALSVGGTKSRWSVHPEGRQSGYSANGISLFSKIQYSYHIPVWRKLGVILGSSLGFQLKERLSESAFKSSTGYHLPGVMTGVIFNYSPQYRIGVAFDAFVERMDNISWFDRYSETFLDLNLLNFVDSIVWLDFFQKLKWGLRFEYHNRYAKYIQPKGEVSGKAINSRLNRIDQWVGVGIVYHNL